MHLYWESHFAAAPAAGWRNLPKTNFFLQRRICPLRESAQKLYFLTRENLPSQNLPKSCISLQEKICPLYSKGSVLSKNLLK